MVCPSRPQYNGSDFMSHSGNDSIVDRVRDGEGQGLRHVSEIVPEVMPEKNVDAQALAWADFYVAIIKAMVGGIEEARTELYSTDHDDNGEG
jgi:hypothetical protein